jgi:hypothetical protein
VKRSLERALPDRARRLLTPATIAAIVMGLTACGASVPLPKQGDHDGDERVLVPSPPPVPKAEIVPRGEHPSADEVWVSGQWLWSGRRWEWEPGTWQTPPPGATYAPPAVLYLDKKQIEWLPGRWHVAPSK